MQNYNDLLSKAYNSIPQKALSHERFVIPKVESFIQGTKTIVRGFNILIKDMRRDKKHFLKWLTKETALPITENAGQLTINGKIGAIQLNKLIESYFNQFVLCPECKKPDTNVVIQNGVHMLKCEACGAIKPVSGL
ncbi:MAG: translation initiation factor IF-2 subunit beta [archaeon]|jgi:translation initiation factor 2 subunit 2